VRRFWKPLADAWVMFARRAGTSLSSLQGMESTFPAAPKAKLIDRLRQAIQRRACDQTTTPGGGASRFEAAVAQILEPGARHAAVTRERRTWPWADLCGFLSVKIRGQREMLAVRAHRPSRGYARVKGRRLDRFGVE